MKSQLEERNASCWLFSSMFIINVNHVRRASIHHVHECWFNKKVSFQFAFSFISLSSLSEIVSLTVTWFQWRTSDEVISHTTQNVTIKYHHLYLQNKNIKYESDFSMLTLKTIISMGKTKEKTPGPPRARVPWQAQGAATCSDQRKDHKVRPMKFKTSPKNGGLKMAKNDYGYRVFIWLISMVNIYG